MSRKIVTLLLDEEVISILKSQGVNLSDAARRYFRLLVKEGVEAKDSEEVALLDEINNLKDELKSEVEQRKKEILEKEKEYLKLKEIKAVAATKPKVEKKEERRWEHQRKALDLFLRWVEERKKVVQIEEYFITSSDGTLSDRVYEDFWTETAEMNQLRFSCGFMKTVEAVKWLKEAHLELLSSQKE